jgi:hypothetical protein
MVNANDVDNRRHEDRVYENNSELAFWLEEN